MFTRTRKTFVALSVLALLATGCGGGDDDSSDASEPASTGSASEMAATEAGSETAAATEAAAPMEVPDEGVFADSLDYGFIYDQTGPTASTQTVFFSGFESHINAVNEAGGVSGRTINIVEEDEQYDVATGVAAYNKLVNQTPVVGMTAMNNSSFQGAVIEDVDENGVPVIGAESTTGLAVNPFREMFYAMECTYADQADVAVAHSTTLVDGEVPKTAVIYGNVASGEEYAAQIQDRVETAGGEFVGAVSVEYGSTEADAQAQQIADLNPDVIQLHGGVSIGLPVLASLAKFGITDVPVIGIFALHVSEVPSEAPEIPYYAVNCYSNGYEGVEGASELIAEAQANGVDQAVYERPEFVNGWMVAQVLAEALGIAGNDLNRASLAAAMDEVTDFSIGALSPVITFGPDDHVGVSSVKPFAFNPDTGQFEGVGEYADYANCLTNEYVNEGIGDYDPVGCLAG